MSSSPRPQYFIAREDGTITPLIAVDELPENVQIAGVPAQLSPAGTVNMISLGLKERSSQRYTVTYSGLAVHSATPSETTASTEEIIRPLEEVETPPANASKKGRYSKLDGVDNWRERMKKEDTHDSEEEKDAKGKYEKGAGTFEEVNEKVKDTEAEPNSPGKSPKLPEVIPSLAGGAGAGTKGTLGRKMYCTHWIRWGECDYTQQGCLYKHEMPDEDKLHEIGIATYPRWYRMAHPEKFGGFTEVPEWHRRPGPAPTDQLWRGGPQARGISAQSWEEFRQNATSQRPPMNNQNSNMAPPAFIVSPYPGNFNPFTGSYMPQPQMQSQTRQQWTNKAPFPRVVNMDSQPSKKSSASNSGANKHTAGTTSASAAQPANKQANAPKTQSDKSASSPNSSSNHATKTTPRASYMPTDSDNVGSPTTANGAQVHYAPAPHSFDLHGSTTANGAASMTNLSQPTVNAARSTVGTRHSSIGSHAPSIVNEAYHPLTPTPSPQHQPAGNFQGNDAKKAEAPEVPILHRRFFVPAGESQFVASPAEKAPANKPAHEGGPAEKARKGRKGGTKSDKMDVESFLMDM